MVILTRLLKPVSSRECNLKRITAKTQLRPTLKTIALIAPLGLLLSGCPSMATFLPSMIPSLVPSVNLTNVNVNNNQISCYPGGTFSSEYCSIPIGRFLAITTNYADPYAESNLFMAYGQKYQRFIFADLDERTQLDKINQDFLNSYPTASSLSTMPDSLRNLLIEIKEEYIPEKNYKKLSEAYTHLYTITALDFATDPCLTKFSPATSAQESAQQLQFMQYKVFGIQYTNAILMHISGSLDSKYDNEVDAYEHLYQAVLKLDPYQLDNLATALYDKTMTYSPKQFESSLYTLNGAPFGELGRFSCTHEATHWFKFGFEYFGTNISGIKRDISFKNPDVYKNYDSDPIPVLNGSESDNATS